MRYFREFNEALEYFRQSGGGMNYDQFGKLWAVGEVGELAGLSEFSPEEQTIYALQEGGMIDSQIEEELVDWSNIHDE